MRTKDFKEDISRSESSGGDDTQHLINEVDQDAESMETSLRMKFVRFERMTPGAVAWHSVFSRVGTRDSISRPGRKTSIFEGLKYRPPRHDFASCSVPQRFYR